MGESFAALMPANAYNWIAVWRRNFLAWRKVALASVLGNLADPITNLFGLGFGLGLIVGRVEGTSYIAFLSAGMVATSAMTSATFETMYATFARMGANRTWEAILSTQLTLGDIVLGELVWAATKSILAGTAIGIVAAVLGYASWPSVLYVMPTVALTGLVFASLAMVVISLAPSYDYFVFYQTLIITPMVFLCGAVFPNSQLPSSFQHVAGLLPLAHSVDLIRPAMLERAVSGGVAVHVGALCIYAVLPFFVSTALFRRRLLR
ncbi:MULTISPECIES: ABC transporter permease [Bradyrhizobium]|uniref:ABC transporter permease n=1 Tax=Bradyrhizobium TaxID=374 RepID=UPI000841C9B8|nr:MULTISPECIES: ABC transporter permease [Bradyrhizobium]MCP1838274.1 lipooligosaccharide transport system permease protein [Bradyrhizobium sp. USDA 4538]MCP1898838.1 lipooligosaccharide transport system permease protein [Bradyrhizobium sp. USDA 4537]MCP1909333.1 lipooligosaccharide transport system permease protein [Bradyrhizobium elkanii]MCP1987049.1 lipooligosaccharide transport system permease protein [Bradyrhizobium sp. USDA 4539]ODM71616.1 nodulation protein NodJ [Bradyrhizobium elkanii